MSGSTRPHRILRGALAAALPFFVAASPAGGEAIGDFLITAGSTWRYLDDGSDPGSAWRAAAFSDAAWSAGPAELGYGDGGEATVVYCGPSAPACNASNYVTTYFRKTFGVTDPASIPYLRLSIRRDDGAVVYLNGAEVARTNMPAGPITATTPASSAISGSGETTFTDLSFAAAGLVSGANVLAVEIHQSSATSSDISFDASLQVAAAPPLALARAPYLQRVTPGGAVVRWRTTVSTSTRVRWGLAPDALAQTVDVAGSRTEHEVALTGLPAETKVFYSVGSASQALAGGDADHAFRTPPVSGARRPTRIWVIGDSGMCAVSSQGCADAAAVRSGYLTYAGSQTANLWLLLGDNAYSSGTDAEFTAGLFDVYPAIMRSTPMWLVPGNHEFGIGGSDSPTQSGPYYDSFTLPTAAEAGGVPSGTEAYYSFDWGNVHVLALDSQDTSRTAPANPTTNVCPPGEGGAMYQWACADLAATTADFVIAIWHHPPYSKGSHDSDSDAQLTQMRERFLPVMEAYGVDLVLTGHSHSYERSVLLDGHYGLSTSYSPALHAVDAGDGDPDGDGAYDKALLGPAPHSGEVSAVVGSSSQISGGALNHPVMEKSLDILGSMVIDVVGRQLDARFIGVSGNVLDHFRIVKGPALPACSNGIDDDADGLVDLGDSGCASASDDSEEASVAECSNGIDDDGDGAIDASGPNPDPGCNLAQMQKESPQCSDLADNDGDGATDYPADTLCQGAWDDDEAANPPPPACGLLGVEALALGTWALRRRRSPRPADTISGQRHVRLGQSRSRRR